MIRKLLTRLFNPIKFFHWGAINQISKLHSLNQGYKILNKYNIGQRKAFFLVSQSFISETIFQHKCYTIL